MDMNIYEMIRGRKQYVKPAKVRVHLVEKPVLTIGRVIVRVHLCVRALR